eukprot:Nk52_evm1s2304 gene=Nk52_evmTU1s2304
MPQASRGTPARRVNRNTNAAPPPRIEITAADRELALERMNLRIVETEQRLYAALAEDNDNEAQDASETIKRLVEQQRAIVAAQQLAAPKADVRRGSASSLDPQPEPGANKKIHPIPKDTPTLWKSKPSVNVEYEAHDDPKTFIEEFEHVLRSNGVPEAQWIRMLTNRVDKDLINWITEEVQGYERNHEGPCPWGHLRQEFEDTFVNPSSPDTLMRTFMDLCPYHEENPILFLARWKTARIRAGIRDDDKLAVMKLREIFCDEVQEELTSEKWKLEARNAIVYASTLSRIAEKKIHCAKLRNRWARRTIPRPGTERRPDYNRYRRPTAPTPANREGSNQNRNDQGRNDQECEHCHRRGHTKERCRKFWRHMGWCLGCGSPNHMVRDCTRQTSRPAPSRFNNISEAESETLPGITEECNKTSVKLYLP